MMVTSRQPYCRAARTVALVCVVLSREVAEPVSETGQQWSSARAQSGLESSLQGTSGLRGLVRQSWAYCQKQKQCSTYSCSPATNMRGLWVRVRAWSVAVSPFACSGLRFDSVSSVYARPTATTSKWDLRGCVRTVVSPQQLQKMMEHTARRAVDKFSRRSWASSTTTGPNIIALDFAEWFVLYARSVSGYLHAVSQMGWKSICSGVSLCAYKED